MMEPQFSEESAYTPPEPRRRVMWMLSFADLLSLMLTFFVMLYSMSLTDLQQWKQAASSLAQRLNPGNVQAQFSLSANKTVTKTTLPKASDLSYLVPVIQAKFNGVDVLKSSSIRAIDDRVIITLPNSSQEVVSALSEMLGSIGNQVELVGHSAPQDSVNGAYSASLRQALHLAAELKRAGYARSIAVTGMGDSRYSDIPASLPTAQRQTAANRVDLVLRENSAGE